MSNLYRHVVDNPPRCLQQVSATEIPMDQAEEHEAEVHFAISQRGTGTTVAKVFGYPLSDYNPKCAGEHDFVSPLSLKWPDGTIDVVFDSDLHGYHGEMECSAKIRGKGEVQAFACPECSNTDFTIEVQFDYFEACSDLWEDEPDIAVQDYFMNITVWTKCESCGGKVDALNMDL